MNRSTADKGVIANIESTPRSIEFPSLNRIQAQLIEVIDNFDVMEPSRFYVSSNDDADNEDSIISSTSIFSSVFKMKHVNKKEPHTPHESPREQPNLTKTSFCTDCEKQIRIHDLTRRDWPQSPHPICVPAVLPPAVLCMNPDCVCTHAAGYLQQIAMANNSSSYLQPASVGNNPPDQIQQIPNNAPPVSAQIQNICTNDEKKPKLSDFIQKLTKTSKESDLATKELYKINFIQPKETGALPKRFVFDLVTSEAKPELYNAATNTKACNETICTTKNLNVNEHLQGTRQSYRSHRGIYNSSYSGISVNNIKEKYTSQNLENPDYYENLEEKNKLPQQYQREAAKVDVYYFDHGNAAYYRTTDSPPIITTELLAEKTENYATKFWAELFGTLYIACAFFTTFILQFFRFLLYSIVRPLTIGLLQLLSDYFFKPLLAAIFNAVLQPPLIFLYNIATSIRDLCEPLADGLGYFIREISVICKSIRLFEIKQDKKKKVETTKDVCKHCECNPN